MNTLTRTRPALGQAISLWTPPLERALRVVVERAYDVLDAWERAARRRAEQRAALRSAALARSLDARTLRDIGLGDWGGPAHDADPARWWHGTEPRDW